MGGLGKRSLSFFWLALAWLFLTGGGGGKGRGGEGRGCGGKIERIRERG